MRIINYIKSFFFNNKISKKIYPELYDNFDKLNNLYYLEITDNKEHQKLSGKISFFWNLLMLFLCAVVFIIIFKFLPQNIENSEGLKLYISILFIFLVLVLLFLMYSSLVQIICSLFQWQFGEKIISKSLPVQILVLLYLGTSFIFVGNNMSEQKLFKNLNEQVKIPLQELDSWLIFLLVLSVIVLVFINYVLNLTILEIENIQNSNTTVTSFLAIFGAVWGIDFESNVIVTNFISFFIFIAVIMTTILPGIIYLRCRNSYRKAEEIFQEQLLVKPGKINYDRLKLCYYYGGKIYRDKMLSNEKMLRKILNKEDK